MKPNPFQAHKNHAIKNGAMRASLSKNITYTKYR